MNPSLRLLRTPFFACLFHEPRKLQALGLSLGFSGVLGFKDGKTTKMLGAWAKKNFHCVILESDSELSSQEAQMLTGCQAGF